MRNYFSDEELRCRETGELAMDPEFMRVLNSIRHAFGKPMIVTSGYRSPKHSKEISKDKPGSHTRGLAVDISCGNSPDRFRLIQLALEHGITRIGVGAYFIHLDMDKNLPQNVMWTYYR